MATLDETKSVILSYQRVVDTLFNPSLKQMMVQTSGIVKDALQKSIPPLIDALGLDTSNLPSYRTPLMLTAVLALKKSLNEAKKNLAEASRIVHNNGWWIVSSMPIVIFTKLPAIEGQITQENLSQLIIDYTNRDNCEHLAEVVNSWTVPNFKSREVLFQDALWAHKEGLYSLTVPALIIHIEGILREFISTSDGDTFWRFDTVRIEI